MDFNRNRTVGITLLLLFAGIVLFFANILLGSVPISASAVFRIVFASGVTNASWTTIILDSRLPMALTALLAGSALAVSGLLMQTMFRNPLAGPSVLGVTSGAGLGVALVVLLTGGVLSRYFFFANLSIILAAFVGAGTVIFLLIFLAGRVGNNVILLIIGLMIGYASSSLVSILQYFSTDQNLHAFVIWGMGSFAQVGWREMYYFALVILLALTAAILLIKPLNLMLLGENYAHNLGLNMRVNRLIVISVSGVLAALVTAFCGPVAFVGIAVPHIVRNLYHSNDHRKILPGVILCGASFTLLCNLIARMPGVQGALPVNAISSLIGAPIVIWVILRNRERSDA
ncbi:MAG: iron ABC transporter permease [Bacteroidia bacterium]|nr:iron ABC transporter permease [Bacteroidia bacterium]